MNESPDVLFSETSRIRARIETLSWQGVSLGTLNIAQVRENPRRPHVLVVGSEEASAVWSEIEQNAVDLPLYPIIVLDEVCVEEYFSVLLRLAPTLKQPVEETIQPMVRRLLQRSGSLYRELASIDQNAELLVQNSQCEWGRCSVGIVGIVRIPPDTTGETLLERLRLLCSNAYAAIDRVPIDRVSTDDLWSLLLVAEAPWTRGELRTKEIESAILREFEGDTVGSRKLIMASNESIDALLGPITGTGSIWHPTSDDPLREQLSAIVKNPEEHEALRVLFSKRLSTDDFDRLVSVLGRKM